MVEQPGEFLRRKTEQEVLIPAAVPTRRKSKKDKRRHAPANKVWRAEGREGRVEGGRGGASRGERGRGIQE